MKILTALLSKRYEKTKRLNVYEIESGKNFCGNSENDDIEVLGSISPVIGQSENPGQNSISSYEQ